MKSEPAAIIGTITAGASAVLVMLRAFGVPITEDQQQAINGFVAVVAPIIAALVIRSFVVAPDTAAQREQLARAGQAVPPLNVPGIEPSPPVR